MNWYLLVLKNYARFSGRARRKEFWMFFLFNILFLIVSIILSFLLGKVIGGLGYSLFYVYLLVVLLPTLAVSVRRLHDVGKSGWMILANLIPLIGQSWLSALMVTEGDPGENKYGPDPKSILDRPYKISYSPKQYWKFALLFFAIYIGQESLFYIYNSGKEFAATERKKVELLTEATMILVDENTTTINLNFFIKVLENNETIPIIMVDENDNILNYRNLNTKKMDKPEYIKRKLVQMKKFASPIEIKIPDSKRQYVYYGKSKKVAEFAYIFIIQIVIIISIYLGIVLDIVSTNNMSIKKINNN